MSAGSKQPRTASLVEAVINISVGFSLGLACQLIFLPPLGGELSLSANLVFAAIMTVVSIARSYVLRRVFEALHIRTSLSPAMLAVIAERQRQIEIEGWTPEHDDGHRPGDLARAGAAYLLCDGEADLRYQVTGPGGEYVGNFEVSPRTFFPWSDWWKPKEDNRRNLVRGCALGLAELEKHDRARMQKEPCATKQS